MLAPTRFPVGPPAGYTSAVCQCALDRVLQLIGAWEQEDDPRGQLSLVPVGGAVCVTTCSQKSYHWGDSWWPRERVTFHPLMVKAWSDPQLSSHLANNNIKGNNTNNTNSYFLTFRLSCTCLCFISQSYPTLHDLMTVARQAPLPMGFSRQVHWSGLPCPPLGDLPTPGIELGSPALQVASLQSELHRRSQNFYKVICNQLSFLSFLILSFPCSRDVKNKVKIEETNKQGKQTENI